MITPEHKRLNWLRLARSESVGSTTFAYLIATYGSASSAIEHLPELARRGGRNPCAFRRLRKRSASWLQAYRSAPNSCSVAKQVFYASLRCSILLRP